MAYIDRAEGLNETSGTTASATISANSGDYLLAVAHFDANGPGDTSVTFSTTSGSTSGWTEIAAADFYNGTDLIGGEAGWATVSSTGSITVQVTTGATSPARYITVYRLSSSGFDVAIYGRDTAGPWATGGLSNTNANATRIIHGVWWGGGTGSAQSPYTDGGALWSSSGFGAFGRTQYVLESSVNSRTGDFATGTGVSPAHITQFIFTEAASGPTNVPTPPKSFRRSLLNRVFRSLIPILHVEAAVPPPPAATYGVPTVTAQRNRRHYGRRH